MTCCGSEPPPAKAAAPPKTAKTPTPKAKPSSTAPAKSAPDAPAPVDTTKQSVSEALHDAKKVDDIHRRDSTLSIHNRIVKAMDPSEDSVPPEDAVYVNMVLLNKNETVRKMFDEKVGYHDTGGSKCPKNWFLNRVGEMAAHHVSDEIILKKVGEVLIEQVPEKIRETGIFASMKVVEFRGPYICFKLVFDDEQMDVRKLLTCAVNEEYANDFCVMQALVRKCGLVHEADQLQKQSIDKAHQGVAGNLTNGLPKQLWQANQLMVDCIACRSGLQAEFESELLAMLGLTGDANVVAGEVGVLGDANVVAGEVGVSPGGVSGDANVVAAGRGGRVVHPTWPWV